MALKEEVRDCWNNNPADYHARDLFKEDDKKFYEYIDEQFLKIHYFGQKDNVVLSSLIDYNSLKGKKVLEIGCGAGSICAEFAKHGAEIYGIDITTKAVELTKKRFELFELKGNIQTADAENLPFANDYFDFVFSWGVIHHTPDTQKAADEIYRVLKKGGEARVMVYHKNSLSYYYHKLIKKGIFQLELLEKDSQGLLNKYTDHTDIGGTPLAKCYSSKEMKKMFGKFENFKTDVYGAKVEVDVIPFSKFPVAKWILPEKTKDSLLGRYGWFLYITARK